MNSPEELRAQGAVETREKPLDGKVALITGSSRDIGAGIVTALSLEGVAVIGNHRDKAKAWRADQVQKNIQERGGRIEFVQADITVSSDREKLQTALNESFGGKLDILVLSASGPSRDINVVAANALLDEFIPQMNEGGKIVLMQSVPGHFARQLQGLDKMPSFYDPIAQAKYEGEQSLRARTPQLQEKGVSLVVVCPPEVEDTFNMKVFRRQDPLVSQKHAEISDILGVPRSVTINDVGEKVAELLKRKDLPMGYVELFGNVLDARSILSQWYGDNAIFVDTLEITDEKHGIGRTIVTKEYTRGHFNEKLGMSVLPGHIMIEAAAQSLGLIALNGKIDSNSMPLFQGMDVVHFFKAAKPGEGLRINGEVTELTRRGFVGNVNITNMVDEKVAEVSGLKAVVVSRDVAMRLLR